MLYIFETLAIIPIRHYTTIKNGCLSGFNFQEDIIQKSRILNIGKIATTLIELFRTEFTKQKLHYIHNNPVDEISENFLKNIK